MKAFIRITFVLLAILVYCGCQKGVPDTILTNIDSTDSTGTGTDSTINNTDSTLAISSFSPDSGRVGTLVTITGRGFDLISYGNTVTINGTAAEVFSSTATGLVIQVGKGTTTGKISVTAYGKTAVSSNVFTILPDSVATTNVWVRKADVSPGSHIFINTFSIDGKGYLFTGADLWAYDPVSNSWTQKKSIPEGYWHRYGFCFAIGSKAYVGLGAGAPGIMYRDDKDYRDVWEYDAVQDTWTQKADFPGSPRVMPFSFSINGFGYVGAGDSANGEYAQAHDFWKYDPVADSWTRLQDFPSQNTIGLSGFSLMDAGYVLEAGPGNPTAPVAAPYSDRLWKYNISANTWEQKAPLPHSDFISGVVFTIGTKAYVALGVGFDPEHPPTEKADFWQYDPVLNTWTKKADTGGGLRWLGTGFAVNDKGYVGLGTGNTAGDFKDDFWEYTPE